MPHSSTSTAYGRDAAVECRNRVQYMTCRRKDGVMIGLPIPYVNSKLPWTIIKHHKRVLCSPEKNHS
jgi:hypothetical protein